MSFPSRPLSCHQQSVDWRSYLQLVDSVWSDHVDQLNTIRNIFLYLDRYCMLMHSVWLANCLLYRRFIVCFYTLVAV